jgi:hypothetical protein
MRMADAGRESDTGSFQRLRVALEMVVPETPSSSTGNERAGST